MQTYRYAIDDLPINYFTSSHPHRDIIFLSFWHLTWKYKWHMFSDILFWHSIWHSILTFYLASILTSYLASFVAFILTFYPAFILTSFWHLFWDSVWHSILARKKPDTCHTLWYYDNLSGICIWHIFWLSFWHSIWYIFRDSFAVGGPAGNTLIRSLRWRSGGERSGQADKSIKGSNR